MEAQIIFIRNPALERCGCSASHSGRFTPGNTRYRLHRRLDGHGKPYLHRDSIPVRLVSRIKIIHRASQKSTNYLWNDVASCTKKIASFQYRWYNLRPLSPTLPCVSLFTHDILTYRPDNVTWKPASLAKYCQMLYENGVKRNVL
jgi:hypothetical protein